MSPSSNTCKQRIGKVHLNEKKRRKLNNFDLREEKMIVLENDNGLPSRSSKGDEYMTDAAGGREVKPQKNKLDCSENYVLISCHLEMLRHSLSSDLHLTQVSLLLRSTCFFFRNIFFVIDNMIFCYASHFFCYA